MAIVEEEVLPLDEKAAPPEAQAEAQAEAPPEASKLERQPAVDWKEKIACQGCGRVCSRHCIEFSHRCKGPKPEKQPRARTEPRAARERPQEQEPPRPPPPSPEQIMTQLLRDNRARQEAIMCGPMRRFYGLQ